ncbi:MAG: hypothetical protein HN348_11755, partial [Proteobacteria bacterium]|nr:hypothetical protein [Pseudomonadota bacterium]
TPDVPETIIEANPPPGRSSRSTAAAQRLLTILIDTALQGLVGANAPQLLHGAAWRPPRITEDDASEAAEPFKRLYYQFQILTHGDKVGAAAGDHISFSAPWFGYSSKPEITRKMVEMTGRMRLMGCAMSIALSASSPLFFGMSQDNGEPTYRTTLTPWESARLGHVWPGRTIMDVSGLFQDPVSFRRTMDRFAATGTLLSGRDVWLVARAQPGHFKEETSFVDLCTHLRLDLNKEEDHREARSLLFACFRQGPRQRTHPESRPREMEKWRQQKLHNLIRAPRNRVEIRTLETPPFFPGNDGGAARTPYQYVKAYHSFLEALFIYLSETPPLVEDLEYHELDLQAAKANEQAVLLAGLDAHIRYIPWDMQSMTARESLQILLDEMSGVIDELRLTEDLSPLNRAIEGKDLTPAARIRGEVAEWYGIDVALRHNMQHLPDDNYPRSVLRRSRQGMDVELAQIEADLPTLPQLDRPLIQDLLRLIERLRR